MELATISYHGRSGWSVPAFPALDSERTLVLLLAAPVQVRHPEPLDALLRAYPQSCVLGCSTAGEISGPMLRDDSLAAAVVRFERASLRQAMLRIGRDAAAAGRTLARELAGPALQTVLLAADGPPGAVAELVAVLGSALPPGVLVAGLLPGEGPGDGRGLVLLGGRASQRGPGAPPGPGWRQGLATAVGLYGEGLRVLGATASGWTARGPERLITHTDGLLLRNLDGAPALPRYLADLGGTGPVATLRSPLCVRTGVGGAAVRAVLAPDEDTAGLLLADEAPSGARGQVLGAGPEELIAGAHAAAAALADAAPPGPLLAVAFACTLRRLVLGAQAEHEVEALRRALPARAVLVGGCGFGQVGPPLDATGPAQLHNQVVSLTLIGEEAPCSSARA